MVSRALAEQLLGKEKMKYIGPKSSSISRGEKMSSDVSDTHWGVRRWIVRMDMGEGSRSSLNLHLWGSRTTCRSSKQFFL